MELTFSNPRMNAVIENWPHGSRRVTATFSIEVDRRGERAVRVTTGAPKKLTYSIKQRIVDGSDGRTYIARHHGSHISIMRGDMKFCEGNGIFPRDPRWSEFQALFGSPLAIGSKVRCNGYDGTIVGIGAGKLNGMFVVRLPGGDTCVDQTQITAL